MKRSIGYYIDIPFAVITIMVGKYFGLSIQEAISWLVLLELFKINNMEKKDETNQIKP